MRKREKKIAYFLFWLLAIARERKYKNSFHYNKWDQNEIYIYIYIFHLMAIFYILCSFILSYFVHVSFFALLWYISMLHSKEWKKSESSWHSSFDSQSLMCETAIAIREYALFTYVTFKSIFFEKIKILWIQTHENATQKEMTDSKENRLI